MTYIPRSSIGPGQAPGAIPQIIQRKRTVQIFGLLSTVMIIGSVVSSVGVFAWEKYEAKQLVLAQESLSKAQSSLAVADGVSQILTFAEKLEMAQGLLDNHLAPSAIFTQLELATKKTVKLNQFKYSYDPGFEATLNISGDTATLMSIALQKGQLHKEKLFETFVLGDIATKDATTEEGVTGFAFSVNGVLNKDTLKYTGEDVASSLNTGSVPIAQGQEGSETLDERSELTL